MKDFLSRMSALYQGMDDAYNSVAESYGFTCEGCTQNCCTQRFFHYTLAEYLYLREGFSKADPEIARKILVKAKVVTDSYLRELEMGELLPLMCPVNFDGKCALYEHRPMICRMHGLPHLFVRPDAVEIKGGGCHRFEENHSANAFVDRTRAYNELAIIERDLRIHLNNRKRIKKTTAEFLIDMLDENPSLQAILAV